eukprot:gnl/MRDRNA2_/MRDRNA2_30115_c0_seq1.p1 gnl/MRDRNA2_/MRDRNA2_30115_c0~~gnl/MRDRNA2_/MRDRNA2_30115_c0_seq1.p1  ORF type:complete len:457 (+),score=137.84 gnl/MRDRNA2_/MRDRNA2_30115_c0_seq1:79-1449(+)
MGNSIEPFTMPQVVRKEGTTLVEIEIDHIDYAPLVAGMKPKGFTPLILVPTSSVCSCLTRIPEGFFAIVTSFGAEKGVYDPGQYCMPPWCNVSYLVTKQLTIFDTPVKDCKTMDNVTVNIDVLIVFEIVEPRNFVYKLGPEKLDGLMRAAQEEALRGLASSVTHDKVFELQGINTESIVEEMNEKFEQYGVFLHHFTVKNVRVPEDLMETIEKKTIFITQEKELRMQQDLNMLKMNNQNILLKIEEEAEVEKQNAEEEAVTSKARIEQEVAAIKSATSKEMARVLAEKEAMVQQIHSDAELEVARLQSEKDSVSREVEAEAVKERNEILVDAYKYKKEMKAKEERDNAENYAKAEQIIGQAEKETKQVLALRRAFDEEKARLQVYKGLSKNSSVRVATSAEVSATSLALRDDSVTQVVQAAVKYARAKLSEFNEAEHLSQAQAPMQQALLGGVKKK